MLEQLASRWRRPWWLDLAAVALLVVTWATQQLLALVNLGWLVWVALAFVIVFLVVIPGIDRARLRAIRRSALAADPDAGAWIVSARSGVRWLSCVLIVDGDGLLLRNVGNREARVAWSRIVGLRMGGGHVSYFVVKLDDAEEFRLSARGNLGYLNLDDDAKKAALAEILDRRPPVAS